MTSAPTDSMTLAPTDIMTPAPTDSMTPAPKDSIPLKCIYCLLCCGFSLGLDDSTVLVEAESNKGMD